MFAPALSVPDRRRRPAALFLTFCLTGGIASALGSIREAPPAEAPPETKLQFPPEVRVSAMLAPPAPARGGPRVQTHHNAVLALTPAPALPTQPLAVPSLLPTSALMPDAPLVADDGGPSGTGGPGGPGDGPGTGIGPGSGTGGGGPPSLDQEPGDALRIRNQVSPEFPSAARAQHITGATCVVHLAVDDHGRPSEAAVTGCDDIFAAPAKEAAMKWRFSPMIANGSAIAGHFLIRFHFKEAAQ